MNIVLVGIWGIGISSIAYTLQNLWYTNIVWIDESSSEITQNLKKKGIKILKHWEYDLKEEDFLIYSDAAINSQEVKKSFQFMNKKNKKFHKPFSYFEFIWELSKYFRTLSITWTHWKTTTSAITAYTLSNISHQYGIGIIWALVPDFQNYNFKINEDKKEDIKNVFDHILTWKKQNEMSQIFKKLFFVIEADEFNKHLLLLDTDYAIITNIEFDHSDCFKNQKDYIQTFEKFVSNTRFFAVWLKKDEKLKYIKKQFPQKVKLVNQKKIKFTKILWKHNQKNASLTYKLIKNIFPTIKEEKIIPQIQEFNWIWRRLEFLTKNKNWALIYTDYWHHPSEIKAVYQALREEFKSKKLFCIFQPHQMRRTLEFYKDFIKTINKFDKKIIYNIYAAREDINKLKKEINTDKIKKSINSKEDIWESLAQESNWKYIQDFEQIKKEINKTSKSRIIIIFSAGDLDYSLRKTYL